MSNKFLLNTKFNVMNCNELEMRLIYFSVDIINIVKVFPHTL